jgi:HlyD family secretion protein
MNRKRIIIFLGITLVILISFFILSTEDDTGTTMTTPVRKGPFEILVYSSGQLESENFTNIMAPAKFQDRNLLRIYELTITNLVDEGTRVDSGDYVATLDYKAVEEQLKSAQDEMDKAYTEFQDAKLDSNLNLSNQRDQIINTSLDLEEKKIIVGESVYESPSIQKKAAMDLDKAKRKHEQEVQAYELKKKQEENKVTRKFINYRQIKDRFTALETLYNSLEVYAPKAGIVTYKKYTFGGVIKTGSKISTWDPVIATIPDMTNLVSRTFINEIDISKVKRGQRVKIGIDAFPDKKLSGEVTNIANIGQAMPNSDAKVFEVKIKVFGEDKDLKPAMTTSNTIFAANHPDTLFIPLDAVFENDSLQFVYLAKPMAKQIVRLGDANENYIIVSEGLKEGDEICLVEPAGAEDMKLQGLDVYEKIKLDKEEQKRREEEARKNFETEENKPKLPPGTGTAMSGKITISN